MDAHSMCSHVASRAGLSLWCRLPHTKHVHVDCWWQTPEAYTVDPLSHLTLCPPHFLYHLQSTHLCRNNVLSHLSECSKSMSNQLSGYLICARVFSRVLQGKSLGQSGHWHQESMALWEKKRCSIFLCQSQFLPWYSFFFYIMKCPFLSPELISKLCSTLPFFISQNAWHFFIFRELWPY